MAMIRSVRELGRIEGYNCDDQDWNNNCKDYEQGKGDLRLYPTRMGDIQIKDGKIVVVRVDVQGDQCYD